MQDDAQRDDADERERETAEREQRASVQPEVERRAEQPQPEPQPEATQPRREVTDEEVAREHDRDMADEPPASDVEPPPIFDEDPRDDGASGPATRETPQAAGGESGFPVVLERRIGDRVYAADLRTGVRRARVARGDEPEDVIVVERAPERAPWPRGRGRAAGSDTQRATPREPRRTAAPERQALAMWKRHPAPRNAAPVLD